MKPGLGVLEQRLVRFAVKYKEETVSPFIRTVYTHRKVYKLASTSPVINKKSPGFTIISTVNFGRVKFLIKINVRRQRTPVAARRRKKGATFPPIRRQ